MEKKLLIIFGLAVCFFSSCKNFGFDESEILSDEVIDVCVEIPAWPPQNSNDFYPQICLWEISVDSADMSQIFVISSEQRNLEIPQEYFFEVKKNEPFCVMAKPVFCDEKQNKKVFFKSAGIIYPFGKNNTRLKLTWEEGFSAFMMHSLFVNAKKMEYNPNEIRDYISMFNWDKFLESLSSKSSQEEKSFNPWLLNQSAILNGIAYANFKASELNLKNVIEVEIDKNVQILSSYIPENENIYKNLKILVKKSEVNVFSDYNLNGILVKGDSVQKLSIENISLPLYIEDYEKKFEIYNSVSSIASSFLQ